MPHLSPPTLTAAEQAAILAATAGHSRDHVIYSLALGTGLRLAEIVGLNVGDVFAPDGRPRNRVRIRPEIAKGGRSGVVFLRDAVVEGRPGSSVTTALTGAPSVSPRMPRAGW